MGKKGRGEEAAVICYYLQASATSKIEDAYGTLPAVFLY